MERLILPTSEIVHEFKEFERLFCFYEEGIRGVVRDTVLLSPGFPVRQVSPTPMSHEPPPLMADGLLEKIMHEYENSLDRRFFENTWSPGQSSSMIESVVALIDAQVAAMMKQFFAVTLYEVCKARWQWVGNDLLTTIHFLETYHDYIRNGNSANSHPRLQGGTPGIYQGGLRN